jgi:hypothetical protein
VDGGARFLPLNGFSQNLETRSAGTPVGRAALRRNRGVSMHSMSGWFAHTHRARSCPDIPSDITISLNTGSISRLDWSVRWWCSPCPGADISPNGPSILADTTRAVSAHRLRKVHESDAIDCGASLKRS